MSDIIYNGDTGDNSLFGNDGGNGSSVPPSVFIQYGGDGQGKLSDILKSNNIDSINIRIANLNNSLNIDGMQNKGQIRTWISQLNQRKNFIISQQNDFSNKYTKDVDLYTKSLNDNIIQSNDDYSNERYGDITSINDLINEKSSLELEIYKLEEQDNLSSKYETINNSNHSEELDRLLELLNETRKKLNRTTALYDNKEFQEKLKQIKSDMDSSSNWTIDSVYVSPQTPMDIHYLPTTVQNPKSQMILNTTGEINRWMAGGDLYDAPRAGDVMFNVTGNLNTVRFLGLQDTNKFPDMVQTFVNPNVSSLFGPMAGDINFSVI